MKILIIPEYDTFGGTLAFLKRLLDIHLKNNIESAVLIQNNQQNPDVLKMFHESGTRVYLAAERQKLSIFSFLSPLFDLLFCREAIRSFRPDMIVVSNGTPGVMTGALLCPVPVVFVMHTYPPVRLRFRVRLYLRLASRMRNRFVTVSRYAATAIHRFMGVPRSRIEVVYNSFHPIEFQMRDRRPMVLTVGHVEWYKNPECWVNVAQRVIARRPEVSFVWLGDGELLEAMRRQVDTLNLAEHISFKGYCANVADYYAQAQVYFQPSLLENHSIAVVEAMAQGLPCVTSDAGGLPESVVNEETGFTCPPDEVECFAERIMALLADQPLRDKMGSAGRKRAETFFTETIQEEKILGIYAAMAHTS